MPNRNFAQVRLNYIIQSNRAQPPYRSETCPRKRGHGTGYYNLVHVPAQPPYRG